MNVETLTDLLGEKQLLDWGGVEHPLSESVSQTSGVLMFRNDDGSSEMGLWQCTVGRWRCEIARDEFCHYLSGRCRYTADNGQIIDIQPGTVAAFPKGWKGECEVFETVRKVYMIQ